MGQGRPLKSVVLRAFGMPLHCLSPLLICLWYAGVWVDDAYLCEVQGKVAVDTSALLAEMLRMDAVCVPCPMPCCSLPL